MEIMTGMGILIRSAWINRENILQGIKNRIFSNPSIRKMAEDRLEICNKCPFAGDNTKDRPYGYLPYRHCTKCGCSLAVKPYDEDSKCPEGKW